MSADIKALISKDQLAATLSEIVNIASPTGEEKDLSSHIAKTMSALGYNSDVQHLNDTQANAIAHALSEGDGRNLLLYAPLDTVTSNSESEDIPWAGPTLRPDMTARANVEDGFVIGLGAHNPKGHAACIIESARVLKQLNVSLAGDLFFGFGAGGMPTQSRDGFPPETGHGAGCAALVSSLTGLDGAIIAKSGLAVTWEEVGFIWLEVTVPGSHTYVGSRHLLPYSNAIRHAGRLIAKLEDWFEQWAEDNATDCVRPQGVVSFIEGGWKRMPAFTPDVCRFRIDLRFGPDRTGDEVEDVFKQAFETFRNELGIEADFKRIETIEASRTPFSDPIIQTTIGCWEELKGRPHEPFTVMSGATDANIIRQAGVPTARVGLPKANRPDLDFALGMNCVAIDDMAEFTELLVRSTISYCGEA